MKTLERVARALVKPVFEWTGRKLPTGLTWDDMADHAWSEFVPLARAALNALLEPSEGMIEWAFRESPHGGVDHSDVKDMLKASIQQSLQEEEEDER